MNEVSTLFAKFADQFAVCTPDAQGDARTLVLKLIHWWEAAIDE